MATFQEFAAIFVKENILEELGIKSNSEYYVGPCVIDLERVESWWNCERETDEGAKTINVKTYSGDVFSLVFDYSDFTKLMK